MSAFDDWYSSKIMWRDERSIPKNLMQEAFNAGLEAGKAERDRLREALQDILIQIREKKFTCTCDTVEAEQALKGET